MEKIDLSRNENSFGPSENVKKAISTLDSTVLSAYSQKESLASVIADFFQIPEEDIHVFYGAEAALSQLFGALHSGGYSSISIGNPSWGHYSALAQANNLRQVSYDLIKNDDCFEYFAPFNVRPDSDTALLICSPNNPTGNSFPIDLLADTNHDETPVVFDATYMGFSENGLSPLKELLHEEKFIVISSFSKFFALAGLRIGFMYLPPKWRNVLKVHKRYLGHNRISEIAAETALADYDYYLAIAKRLRTNRSELKKYFLSRGLRVYNSDANFLLIESEDISSFDSKKYANFLLSNGIKIKTFSEKYLENCFRITIGTCEQIDLVTELTDQY